MSFDKYEYWLNGECNLERFVPRLLPSGPPNRRAREVEEQHLGWEIRNAKCKKIARDVKLRRVVVEYAVNSRTPFIGLQTTSEVKLVGLELKLMWCLVI